jgi:hypothetical protein
MLTSRPTREAIMSDTVDALVLDLLEWIGARPRPYAEVLDAWRTSCPRLPVWETAEECGFIDRRPVSEGVARVAVSAAGAEHLRLHRRPRDGAHLA